MLNAVVRTIFRFPASMPMQLRKRAGQSKCAEELPALAELARLPDECVLLPPLFKKITV